jgi:predicted GIY-YIG superfamily endonuclease
MNAMYVYSLADPRSGVRYVGVTGNPTRRLHRHLRAARRGERTPVARWLRSIRRRPTLNVLAVTTRETAADAERTTIASLRATGAALVNRTNGGDGLITLEHVALLAAGMRRLWTKTEYRDYHAALMRSLWSEPRTRARWLKTKQRKRRETGTRSESVRERTTR